MSASAHSAYCRGNAIRNQATMAVVTVPNSSGNSVSHMLPTVVMRSCSTMLRHHGRNVLQPTRGFKRRCASTTSRVCPDANGAQGVGPPKHAILDVTVIEPFACGGLDDFLATRRLILRWTMSLMPAHFLAQALRPSVAGIYVFPSSAPLHVAHRRVGARTQSRVEIPAGGCLLRGDASRHEWTLALPPLLTTHKACAYGAVVSDADVATAGERAPALTPTSEVPRLWSERVRKFAVLADSAFDLDADEEVFEFESHRPRAP